MAKTRSFDLGPGARPESVPADLEADGQPKASGKIELPLHIRWSGGRVVYDLDDRQDPARVYEQVLREGTDEDIRYYIDAEELLDL